MRLYFNFVANRNQADGFGQTTITPPQLSLQGVVHHRGNVLQESWLDGKRSQTPKHCKTMMRKFPLQANGASFPNRDRAVWKVDGLGAM